MYHLIGALFMKFCIIVPCLTASLGLFPLSEVFCKGRIQASAPPFLLQLFQRHVFRV